MNFDRYDWYISIVERNQSKNEMETYFKTFRQELVQTLLMPYIKKDRKILDIGCQFGYMSLPLASTVNSVICLDIAPWAVKKARDKAQSSNIANAFFLVGDAESLPFQSNSLDAILFIEIIEHLADATSALAEMHRVLKPGGVLLIGTPKKTGIFNVIPHFLLGFIAFFLKRWIIFKSRKDEFFTKLHARGLKFPPPNQESNNLPSGVHPKARHGHVRKYSRRRLIKMLQAHGFQFVKETGVALFLTRMIKYYFAFPWLIKIYKRLFNPQQSFLLSRFGNQMYLLFRCPQNIGRTTRQPDG